MFCPNCGTQNPDSSQACSKCSFQLKGSIAPKFKGTMMMNQAPVVPTAPTPPAPPVTSGAPRTGPVSVPGQGPGAAAGPSAFKGTVVGMAPGMAFGGGIAPTPPRAPSAPPPAPAFAPGGTPFGAAPPPPQQQGFPPQQSAAYGPPNQYGAVNPMGSTVADSGPSGPPQGQPDQGYGAPQGYGQPQQGYGSQPPPQAGAGPYGAPGQQGQQYGGYGAPQQQGGGGPGSQQFGYDATQNPNAAMQPAPGYGVQQYGAPPGYGQAPAQPGMMMAPGAPGAMMQGDGTNGPKGQVRKGSQVLLFTIFSFGFYQVYWLLTICSEMSAFLKRDEPSGMKVLLFSFLSCGGYALYWQAVRLGALIGECQQRAGTPNPQNLGWMYIIPYYNLILATDELNKAWQTPG